MRRVLLSLAATALCACGGGSGSNVDNAPNFVGMWSGTITVTDTGTGQNTTGSGSTTITSPSANTLVVGNACEDGSGPTATVTSATQFATTAAFVCPPVTDNMSCASIVFTFNSLSGTLTGSTLGFTSSVTGVGCGDTESLTVVLSGATK